MTNYRPRGMPRRFMEGAPEIVRCSVIDLIAIVPAAPLDLAWNLTRRDSLGDAFRDGAGV